MKTALLTLIAATSLTYAAPAQASTGDISIGTPFVGVTRSFDGFTASESYTIPTGDAAIITYKVYRHRSGPGFELVRKVKHVVGAGNAWDAAHLRTMLWSGVGYKVKVKILDVETATLVKAPTVKVHL